jgi:hypothetical protein
MVKESARFRKGDGGERLEWVASQMHLDFCFVKES